MQIEFVGAAPNATPVEAAGASTEEATGTGSFADLLSAAGEESSESTPTDEGSDDPSVDEWATVPVFVPFIPVVPPQDVIDVQLPDAENGDIADEEDLSIEAVNQVPAATPVDGQIEGAGTSIGASPAPLNPTAIAPAAAPSAFESSAPAESVETETITAANPALPAEPGTEAETVVAASSKTADTDKPAKQTSAVNPTAGMPDVSNAAQDTATQPVPSAEVQNASSDVGNSMPATIDTPPEPTSGHKGAAARLLARALERAAEAAAPHHVATAAGNGSQSFDSADPQSSFGDWLREQLPHAANAGAQSASAGTFNFVAPSAQHDVRVAGVISSPETSLMPGGPVLPREHDVTMQLVQSLRLQFRDGIGEAVLKLKPEHLGSVAISLRVENGGLKANVQADLPAVRQWLESQQDTLRSALAEHGLRLDRFDVEPDGHRHASPEEQQERSPRKRQTRRSPQSDQPVFEVVV